MSTVIFGELLILLLLLVTTLRPFFRNYYDEHDNSVVIAPIALVLSLFLMFGSGVSVSAIAVLVPSAFVFILNFRALLRFFSKLKIDGHTGTFKVFSFLCFLLTVASGVLLFGLYPRYDTAHIKRIFANDIEQTPYNCTGSFTDGFVPKTQLKERTTARFYTFCPKGLSQEEKTALPLIVFIPDVYATVNENATTIEAIARNGNMVVAADFFCTDKNYVYTADGTNKSRARSFTLRNMRIFSPEKEGNFRSAWTTIKAKETELVYRFALYGAWRAPNETQSWAQKKRALWQENAPDWATAQNGRSSAQNGSQTAVSPTMPLAAPADSDKPTPDTESAPRDASVALNDASLGAAPVDASGTGYDASASNEAAHGVRLIVADGDASLAAEQFLGTNRFTIPLLTLTDSIPGYIKGMGNLAVLQPAVYRYIARVATDGTIQAQHIASRAEKLK